MTRALERQITDSVIEVKTKGATKVRLRANGTAVYAEVVESEPKTDTLGAA